MTMNLPYLSLLFFTLAVYKKCLIIVLLVLCVVVVEGFCCYAEVRNT